MDTGPDDEYAYGRGVLSVLLGTSAATYGSGVPPNSSPFSPDIGTANVHRAKRRGNRTRLGNFSSKEVGRELGVGLGMFLIVLHWYALNILWG